MVFLRRFVRRRDLKGDAMQDRVPLYPGRVTLTPVAGQANTYDMTRADQPTQEGTPLNKASLLKDATATMLGLDAAALPDDALEVLGRFHQGLGNEYFWKKQKTTFEDSIPWTEFTTKTGLMHGQAAQNGVHPVKYSDEFEVIKTGELRLKNPETVTLQTGYNIIVGADVLKGKYIMIYSADTFTGSMVLQYIYPDATLESDVYGELYASHVKTVQAQQCVRTAHVEVLGYLNSPHAETPPAGDDGIEYISLGQLGGFCRAEYGTYIGTGKYGEDNPTTLTFSGTPLFVLVLPVKDTSTRLTLINGVEFVYANANYTDRSKCLITWGDKSLFFYNENAPDYQLNSQYVNYVYFAIVR